MITIITPATKAQLTTVNAVKEQLCINDTAKDGQINRAILTATDFIQRITGQVFAKETIEEKVAGFGDTNLMLTRTPIISVASIMYNAEPVIDFEITDAKAGFLYRESGWVWTTNRFWPGDPIPSSEKKDFIVTYDAGYVMPGVTGRNLPYDLEDVAIELVRIKLEGQPLNVENIRVGDYSATFSKGLPIAIKETLRQYTRIL